MVRQQDEINNEVVSSSISNVTGIIDEIVSIEEINDASLKLNNYYSSVQNLRNITYAEYKNLVKSQEISTTLAQESNLILELDKEIRKNLNVK